MIALPSARTPSMRLPKPVRTSRAPLAIASDGTVIVNAVTLTTNDSLDAVIEAAKAAGGTVFVGVAMSPGEVNQALHQLDDAAAEIAARVGAGRRR